MGFAAGRAEPADEALGDDADDVAGEDVGKNADVEQARNGADGRAGVQCGEDLVPGHGGLQGHAGRVGIAYFTNKDDVRILPQHGAHAVGEIEAGGIGNGRLPDHRHRVLDRILQRHDVDAFGVDVAED